MKSRAVRLTLFLLFVISAGVTAYLFWMGDMRGRAEEAAARDFDDRAVAASLEIASLRLSQQAYVAAGQGDQFWAGKVASTLGELKASLATLRTAASSLHAQSALDQAAASLDDFEQMDRRARDQVSNGQRLLASDLIFGDGLELSAAGASAIDQARRAEREARDTTIAGIRNRQLFAVAAGAAAALLVVLLLVPSPKRAEVEAEPVALDSIAPDSDSPELGAALDEGWSRAVAPVAAAPAPPAVDIASIAALCTDLGKLTDTRSLPTLLERAAAALDANGIVLWIADPDGRELSPIVTHGYAPNIVTRLGTITRDAENATAAALRTGLLQTVKTDAVSNGAIAAPLVTPTGCVGVMAAEVRNEGERSAEKLAAATIVAAQLATLVGPPSARQAKAEAAG